MWVKPLRLFVHGDSSVLQSRVLNETPTQRISVENFSFTIELFEIINRYSTNLFVQHNNVRVTTFGFLTICY